MAEDQLTNLAPDLMLRMNPVATLRAAAKTRRAHVREQVHYSDDFGDPMTVEAKFKHDGRPLIVRASNSRFEIEPRLETALMFSVGAPNRWWSNEPVGVLTGLTGTQVPLFGAANHPAAASRETMLAWIAEPAHQALFERLRLQPSEAVHVAIDRVWVVLRGDRVLDESLFDIVVSLAAALESVRLPPPPPESPEQPFDGPPELDAFVREFGHLAEGDDVLRSELSEQLSEAERAEFVRRVKPLFPAINAYLDSLKGRPWPDQAITLSQLGEFGGELANE